MHTFNSIGPALPCLFPLNECACARMNVDSFLCCVTANSIQFSPIKRHHYDLGKTNIPSHLPSPLRPLVREAGDMAVEGALYCTSSKFVAQRGPTRHVMALLKYYYDFKLYRIMSCVPSCPGTRRTTSSHWIRTGAGSEWWEVSRATQ